MKVERAFLRAERANMSRADKLREEIESMEKQNDGSIRWVEDIRDLHIMLQREEEREWLKNQK